MIRSGEEIYSIIPAAEGGYDGSADWHVVIDDRDVIDNGELCGTSTAGATARVNPGPSNPTFGTTYFLTEIGIDADFEFFNENGSSVNNTVADIENVMNAVSAEQRATQTNPFERLATVQVLQPVSLNSGPAQPQPLHLIHGRQVGQATVRDQRVSKEKFFQLSEPVQMLSLIHI